MTTRLDHVQIAIPFGGEKAARNFFGDALGLRELPKPADLSGNGGCWFALETLQLHCGVDPHFRPAKKAHIALSIDDLAALRDKLASMGATITGADLIEGRARFFTEDPFGNRLEFIASAAPPPSGEREI
ncbi:VOC family protein [Novosphingopyxis sp.]|uniref:VOC family protein n=1 Tax=Novosphingopyxis sp. TaxID=2709690 RepID=UPI003B595118